MLKQFVNEAVFSLEIVAQTPVLIKSGFTGLQIMEDMAPLVTFKDGEEQPLLPGSSLKGVFRSHAERIMRTLSTEDTVCDLFSRHSSCGGRLQRNVAPKDAYAGSCPACRLFGSTAYSSRFYVDDAYIVPGTKWTYDRRDGVGIDRFTGGVAGPAKFEMLAVAAGARWNTKIAVRNFEGWQLGIVFAVLRDLEDGYLRLGSASSRGFGAVRGEWKGVTLNMVAREQPSPTEVWGLGRWLGDGSYGTRSDDVLPVDEGLEWQRRGVRWQATVEGQVLSGVAEAAGAELVRRLEMWPRREQRPRRPEGGRR